MLNLAFAIRTTYSFKRLCDLECLMEGQRSEKDPENQKWSPFRSAPCGRHSMDISEGRFLGRSG